MMNVVDIEEEKKNTKMMQINRIGIGKIKK